MPEARHRDGVYQRKDRAGWWASWIDANGYRHRRKLNAATKQQARTLLAAEKARVDRQKTLGYAEPAKDLFASVADRFLKFQKVRVTPESWTRIEGVLRLHLNPAFGAMAISAIHRVDVERYVTRRAGETSPASVTKELNTLKHLLNLCIDWELIPYNPASRVTGPRVPAGRVRYLQPNDLRAVLKACPDWLRPIAALAAFTGMRRSEILGLRWLNVDLDGNRLMLAQTKNGDGRIVYLNHLAAGVVRSQRTEGVEPSSRVFPLADRVTADDISKGFKVACRHAGIEDFHFHDLRHTAASWMRMRGADIHTVAQVLGHKDLRMAARYQHLSPEFLQDAVGTLDSFFGPSAKGLLPGGPEQAR